MGGPRSHKHREAEHLAAGVLPDWPQPWGAHTGSPEGWMFRWSPACCYCCATCMPVCVLLKGRHRDSRCCSSASPCGYVQFMPWRRRGCCCAVVAGSAVCCVAPSCICLCRAGDAGACAQQARSVATAEPAAGKGAAARLPAPAAPTRLKRSACGDWLKGSVRWVLVASCFGAAPGAAPGALVPLPGAGFSGPGTASRPVLWCSDR